MAIKQNFKRRLELARQGSVNEQHNVGVCYAQGLGVFVDAEKAHRWFVKAANNGHVLSRLALAVRYRDGVGVEMNFVESIGWGAGEKLLLQRKDEILSESVLLAYIKQQVDQGCLDSLLDLGAMHLQSRKILGGKNERNVAVGVEMAQKAARLGHRNALIVLAELTGRGEALEKDLPKALAMLRFAEG